MLVIKSGKFFLHLSKGFDLTLLCLTTLDDLTLLTLIQIGQHCVRYDDRRLMYGDGLLLKARIQRTPTSCITFDKSVSTLGRPRDLSVTISTSASSSPVVRGLEARFGGMVMTLRMFRAGGYCSKLRITFVDLDERRFEHCSRSAL